MKILSSFSLLFLVFVSPYERILSGLEKNFVLLLDEIGEDAFYEYYEIDSLEYSKFLLEYKSTLRDFYSSEQGLIEYLMLFENNHQEICLWITTANPYKSKIVGYDLLSKSKGALILIDNFLIASDTSRIVIHEHIEKLTFTEINAFYKSNKHLTVSEMRKEYLAFVRRFGYSQ